MYSKKIVLDSNATTGYRWEVAFSDGLDFTDDYVIEEPVMPGKPGKQVFTFISDKPGEYKVELVYRRHWEDSIAESRTIAFRLG